MLKIQCQSTYFSLLLLDSLFPIARCLNTYLPKNSPNKIYQILKKQLAYTCLLRPISLRFMTDIEWYDKQIIIQNIRDDNTTIP